MEIETLREETSTLARCPVWITDRGDTSPCDADLVVQVTRTIRGDDYGSWSLYTVYFRCGHTLEQMAASLDQEV